MTKINIYLNFEGNCREAMEFYRSVFRGEFAALSTFADMPSQEGMLPIKEEEKDLIMHMSLPISKETILMASDTGGEWSEKLKKGNNFSISVDVGSEEEANRIFKELSKDGNIMMPMDKLSGVPTSEC